MAVYPVNHFTKEDLVCFSCGNEIAPALLFYRVKISHARSNGYWSKSYIRGFHSSCYKFFRESGGKLQRTDTKYKAWSDCEEVWIEHWSKKAARKVRECA